VHTCPRQLFAVGVKTASSWQTTALKVLMLLTGARDFCISVIIYRIVVCLDDSLPVYPCFAGAGDGIAGSAAASQTSVVFLSMLDLDIYVYAKLLNVRK
jgi:hypothetical protein